MKNPPKPFSNYLKNNINIFITSSPSKTATSRNLARTDCSILHDCAISCSTRAIYPQILTYLRNQPQPPGATQHNDINSFIKNRSITWQKRMRCVPPPSRVCTPRACTTASILPLLSGPVCPPRPRTPEKREARTAKRQVRHASLRTATAARQIDCLMLPARAQMPCLPGNPVPGRVAGHQP